MTICKLPLPEAYLLSQNCTEYMEFFLRQKHACICSSSLTLVFLYFQFSVLFCFFTSFPRRAFTQASDASQMAVRSCPPSRAKTTRPLANVINCFVKWPKPTITHTKKTFQSIKSRENILQNINTAFIFCMSFLSTFHVLTQLVLTIT